MLPSACAWLIGGCAGTQRDAHRPDASGCRLTGTGIRLHTVEVAAGGERFWLQLEAVPAQIEMFEGDPLARVEVLAPLRFSATVAIEQLPLRAALATDLFSRPTPPRRDLPDGYEFRFPASRIEALARFIVNERRCCPFVNFELLVGASDDVRLRMTGPPGAREVLQAELSLDTGTGRSSG